MKAYPHTKHFSDYHDNNNMNGMDLRDYFAAKAMQALAIAWAINKSYLSQDKELAECSYQVADAMMKAREL